MIELGIPDLFSLKATNAVYKRETFKYTILKQFSISGFKIRIESPAG